MNARRCQLGLSFSIGLLLVGACSSGTSSERADGGVAEQFFSQRDSLICRMNLRCCSGESLQAGSVEECLGIPDFAHSQKQRFEDSVARGRVQVDWRATDRCFAAIEALSCEDWSEVLQGRRPPECEGVMTGQSVQGAPCSKDYDCASSFCDLTRGQPNAANMLTDGVCAPKLAEGARCEPNLNGCEDGLVCRGTAGSTTCIRRGLVNQACTRSADCHSGICSAGACTGVCWGEPLSHELFGR